MGDRMTCPGCSAYTSDVLSAYLDGLPCPYCGLPSTAAREVLAAQRCGADAALTEKYTALVVQAGQNEAELQRLRNVVDDIRIILEGLK